MSAPFISDRRMPKIQPHLSYDAVLESLGIRPISHFSHSRDSLSPKERLKQVQFQARRFKQDFKLINQQVRFFRSVDLVSLPYSTRSAFGGAANLITPYLYLKNRLFIIQIETPSGLKTLLFSPSDLEANRNTPYFQTMIKALGRAGRWCLPIIAPVHNSVESALNECGIKPEDVDFISYDHLHTQDLRKWLGSYQQPAYFPNAKLLVMHQEWEAAKDLLPLQKRWYCPDGLDGIEADKIIPLHSSVMLGNSAALIHTPGLTLGCHSLMINTDAGICVISANGIAADSYSPEHSTIYGIHEFHQKTGMEVIPNGKTQEASLDQYISMMLEKTLADAHPEDPRFYNIIPSSELVSRRHPFSQAPSISFGELCLGTPDISSTPTTSSISATLKTPDASNPRRDIQHQTINNRYPEVES